MKSINKLFLGLLLLCSLSFVYADDVQFYNPSFDCGKVKKDSVEYMICTNEILSLQDNILTNAYNSLTKLTKLNIKKIKDEQKNWLINRKQCKDYKCLKVSYENRIKQFIYIYELYIKNDFLPLERIKVANPDDNDNMALKDNFTCKSKIDSQVLARDKEFYFIDDFSKYNQKEFSFFVNSSWIDEISNEQILKGTLTFDSGQTYQPTAIEFFTYGKNWDCKLNTSKY